MARLIDASELIQLLCINMDSGEQFDKATHCVDVMPTVDAVPISFIEEQARLCNELGFRRGEECFIALIERWRETNDKTD